MITGRALLVFCLVGQAAAAAAGVYTAEEETADDLHLRSGSVIQDKKNDIYERRAAAFKEILDERSRSGRAAPSDQMLQRITGGGSSFAELDSSLKGKCDTDCKQDKKIHKHKRQLKGTEPAYDKIFKELKRARAANVTMEEWMLEHVNAVNLGVANSTKNWKAIKQLLSDQTFKIGDGADKKFVKLREADAKMTNSIASLYNYQKKMFTELNDAVKASRAKLIENIKDDGNIVYKNSLATNRKLEHVTELLGRGRDSVSEDLRRSLKNTEGATFNGINAANGEAMRAAVSIRTKVTAPDLDYKSVARALNKTEKRMGVVEKDVEEIARDAEGENAELHADYEVHIKDEDGMIHEENDIALNYLREDIGIMTNDTLKSLLTEEGEAKEKQLKMDERAAKLAADRAAKQGERAGRFTGKLGTAEGNIDTGESNLGEYEGAADSALGALTENATAQKASINKAGNDLKKNWAEQQNKLSNSFNNALESGNADMLAEVGILKGASKESKAKLMANLAAVDKAADMGLGALEDKLGDFSNALADEYDAGTSWQNDFGDLLAGFGEDVQTFESDSSAQLGALSGGLNGDITAGKNNMGLFGSSMMASLNALNEDMAKEGDELSEQAKQDQRATNLLFASMLGDKEKIFGKGSGRLTAGMDKFQNGLNKDDAKYARLNKANKNAANGVTSEAHALLNQGVENSQAAMGEMNGYKSGIAGMQMQFNKKMSGDMKSAQNSMYSLLKDESAENEGKVDAWLQVTTQDMDGKQRELSTLERAMRKNARRFSSESERIDVHSQKLEIEAQKINSKVDANFAHAVDALNAEKLNEATNEKELREAIEKRQVALDRLRSKQISSMSQHDQDRFDKEKAEHEKRVGDILRNQKLSLKEKQNLIHQADDKLNTMMRELREEARVTDTELKEVKAAQIKGVTAVAEASARMKDMCSASDLLMETTAADRKQRLDERASHMKELIMGSVDSADHQLGLDIEKVQEEVNSRIMMVLEASHLSEEEKQKEIEKIEAFSDSALTDLVQKQAATEQNMGNYMEEEKEKAKTVAEQLTDLDGSLNDEQMAWMRAEVEEKEVLKQQTEHLVQLVDQLMSTMEQQQLANGNGISAEEKARSEKLRRMRGDLDKVCKQRAEAAGEALTNAKAAEAQAAGGGTELTGEIDSLESKSADFGEKAATGAADLWAWMSAVKQSRSERTISEGGKLVQSTKDLTDKLDEVTKDLAASSKKSKTEQGKLGEKIDMVMTMVDAELSKSLLEQSAKLTGIQNEQSYLDKQGAKEATWEAVEKKKLDTTDNETASKVASLQKEVADNVEASQVAAAGITMKLAAGSQDSDKRVAAVLADGQTQILEGLDETAKYMSASEAAEEEVADVEKKQRDAIIGQHRWSALREKQDHMQQQVTVLAEAVRNNNAVLVEAKKVKDQLTQAASKDRADLQAAKAAADALMHGRPSSFAEDDSLEASLDGLASELDVEDVAAQRAKESTHELMKELN